MLTTIKALSPFGSWPVKKPDAWPKKKAVEGMKIIPNKKCTPFAAAASASHHGND